VAFAIVSIGTVTNVPFLNTINFLPLSHEAEAQVGTKGNPESWNVAAGYQYTFFMQNPNGVPCYNSESGDSSLCTSTGSARPVYVETYYNSFQKEFYLQVKYPRLNGRFPEGMAFVINSGSNPSQSGEWAVVYVDASKSIAAPILTAYAYNGTANGILDSWRYGNAYTNPSGSDGLPADRIVTTLNPPANFHTGVWSTGLKLPRRVAVEDIVDNVSGSPLNGLQLRVFTVIIDAKPLINNVPDYPGVRNWKGIDIGGGANNPNGSTPKIGAWIWGFNGLQTAYDSAGYLTNWLAPSTAGSTLSSFILLNKGITDWCPIDCTGTLWGAQISCGTTVTPTPTPTVNSSSCTTQEFTNNLFALDGGAAGLYEVVKYGTQRLKLLARGLPRKRRNAIYAFADEAKKSAEDQFLVAWSISWSYPQFITQCTGTLSSNCTLQDLTVKTANYVDATDKINTVSGSVSKRLRKLGTKRGLSAASRVDTMAKMRLDEALAFSSTIPDSTVQCTR
jgi:hypothetical protein